MDAWDKFTIILQENKMQDYLNKVYKHKHLATAKANDMTAIIQETAQEWYDKHNEHNDLIKQIIDSTNNWIVKQGFKE